jgi:hypothetical protein
MQTEEPDLDLGAYLSQRSLEELQQIHEAVTLAIALFEDNASRIAAEKKAEAKMARALLKKINRLNKNGKPRKERWDKGRKRIVIPVPETPADQVTE